MKPVEPDRVASTGLGPVLDARLECYDLLTHTFLQEPTPAFVTALVRQDVTGLWPLREVDPAMEAALVVVSAFLAGADATPDEICDVLRRDYTRLFVGPGRPLAPPWESVYTDVERLHFAEDTLRVRTAYRKHGLQVADLGREPDDHLGFELDFLRRLCASAIERAEARDGPGVTALVDDQRAFLEDHLLRWVPAWAADVATHAHTGFYRGMAALVSAFLMYDLVRLDDLIAAACGQAPSA